MEEHRFEASVNLKRLESDFLEFAESFEEDGIAVAAIRALTAAISDCKASTLMQLEIELKAAVERLREQIPSSVELSAVTELFLRYVTRSVQELAGFSDLKKQLAEHGTKFGDKVKKSRELIADYGSTFIKDGVVVLTHGYSTVVLNLIKRAAAEGNKHFEVFVTEGRPHTTGYKMANELKEYVPVTLIMDTAVAHYMEKVDLVVVGAEGVVENGGIIGPVGTFSMAVAAKAMNTPFYIAAESHKFARIYPMNQGDIPPSQVDSEEFKLVDGCDVPEGVACRNPAHDYTPPSFISLLFTDLGVLTTAAVSDELIKLYF
uniref:Translation initiation factor eIF2B subunit alpha n=1 Tax=Palpitomonas bilix TaxID=652834 RepID=A0A7S3D0I0_9EUKA|mmetsp:Transcript_16915/g.42472  ORF Transcript_16915/g.42472 Transcript_16915/m.42472 type:complete len:318 (+) Transcript_16915:339-1292(+)